MSADGDPDTRCVCAGSKLAQLSMGVSRATLNVRSWQPAQPVDATQALNLSAGVSNCMVSRGSLLVWFKAQTASARPRAGAVPLVPARGRLNRLRFGTQDPHRIWRAPA